LDTGGVLVLVLSIAASVFGYSTLPSQTQIHWALGGPYYGPEYVSTPIVLIGFPLLVAGFYAGSRWLRGHLAQIEGFDAVRPLYHGCLLLLFAGILIVQFVIILLNLH
jgi:hypothetical protein